jgi:hypothetical protein
VGVWDEMQKANNSSARRLDWRKSKSNAESSRLGLERRVARGRARGGGGVVTSESIPDPVTKRVASRQEAESAERGEGGTGGKVMNVHREDTLALATWT